MFAAISAAESGLWIGPSANDAVHRIHAFRHIPDRNLVVVVAMNEDEAMHARLGLAPAGHGLRGLHHRTAAGHGADPDARRHDWRAGGKQRWPQDRTVLAASNAQLEVARALAAAKAEQLEATLAGMTDGVSMVDGHMCLVEWNARFPEIAGVPAEILRVGLPMEEMLRAQVRPGSSA